MRELALMLMGEMPEEGTMAACEARSMVALLVAKMDAALKGEQR